MAVGDSALCEVVRREFQRNLITVHDLDPITTKLSGHRRQHGSACVDLYGKHPSLELLDDLAHYFDCVFFWQTLNLPV